MWGKGHSEKRQPRGNIERQSKYMATTKAIEDLETHEMAFESKLPKEAAKDKRQTTKGAVNIQKAKLNKQAKSHTRQEARK